MTPFRAALVLAALIALQPARAEAPPASPLLPPTHWAVEAAERLYELGLAPGWMPAQRAAPLLVVARTLREGAALAAQAPATAPAGAAPLARAWAARFDREFPHLAGYEHAPGGGAEATPALLAARATVGATLGSARPIASAGTPPAGLAALRLQAPGDDPFLELGGAAAAGPHLAAGLTVRGTPSSVTLPAAEVVAALGPLALSAGRATARYGPSDFGGVVLGGAATLDRVELLTTAPVRLPGPLAFLGDFSLDLLLTRFDEPRHPYHPLLWGMQLSWRPHPRLTLAAIRGVLFGGALWEGIPAARVPLSILGIKNYRENNVYSGAIRYRLPTERVVPLTFKLEWGTDDNPGAAFSWPGLVVGLSSPLLPALPAALGIEYAYFGRGPMGYHDPFPWYAHGQYTGGWATGETPLGDPLGGNGRALRVTGSADPLGGLARVRAAAWVQDRFADNLYAPAAGGRSAGVEGEAELRLGTFAAGLRGAYERGTAGWSRKDLALTGTLFF